MRIAFIVLLLANLGFMAWAIWVDTPAQVQTSESTARLPRLKLVTEATPPRAQGEGGNSAATASKVSIPPPSGVGTASPAVNASKSAAGEAGAKDIALTPTEPTAQAERCVTVGPFNDLRVAARAASALQSRGFTLQQRAEKGDVVEGFWVYIGGVDSVDKADRILRALDKGGFKDAHLMADDGDGRRISVGMFSERERAERRARAVEKLGLKTEVAERTQPGTIFWVDLALRQSDGSVPIQDLLADTGSPSNSRVVVQSCPAALVARPGATPSGVVPADSVPTGVHAPSTTVAGTPQLKEAR